MLWVQEQEQLFVNAGLETYSLSNLVKNVYREDYLITEMNTLKEDISDLKTTAQTWTIPDDFVNKNWSC